MDDLAAWRKAQRAELIERRKSLPLDAQRDSDHRIGALLLEGFPLLEGLTLGFYWPFKGEVDPRVALLRLRERGTRAALPVVVAKGAPLEFREWHPGVESDPGVFGLPVPRTAKVLPDAVLMPPVGFDVQGYRLGYGGGYFDRTLASLSPRPLAIGIARELSRIETIHPQPWDVPMDFVVTEAAIHEVRPEGLRAIDAAEAGRLARALRERRRAP